MTGAVGISARLLPRVGPRRLMLPGLLIVAGALTFLTQITVGSSYWLHVFPGLVALGLGMGMTFMPSMATATGGVRGTDAGVVSATLNTTQQVGGSVGIALLNTVAASATAHWLATNGGTTPAELAQAAVHGFTNAMWISVSAILVAAALTAILVNVKATHGRKTEATGHRDTVDALVPVRGSGIADEEGPAGMHA